MTAKTRLQKVIVLALIACLFASITLTVGAAFTDGFSIASVQTDTTVPTETDIDVPEPTPTDPPADPTTTEPTTEEPSSEPDGILGFFKALFDKIINFFKEIFGGAIC